MNLRVLQIINITKHKKLKLKNGKCAESNKNENDVSQTKKTKKVSEVKVGNF